MRVVGGGLRGRRLKGAAALGVRPTSELVRGAIFNILGPLDSSARAVDLFAGSGSLGIEALSRGVEWVDFVERHPRQCEVLRENLETVRMTDNSKVHCMDVAKALQSLDGPYSLVLMDPPYKLQTVGEVLDALGDSDLLEDDAVLVVGHSKRLSLEDRYTNIEKTSSHRYGDSMVDFFLKGGR